MTNTDKMEEEWRDVVGWEGLYRVSNKGQVMSLKTRFNKIIKLGFTGRYKRGTDNNYLTAQLSVKGGETRNFKAHRLVALAFIPNPEGKEQINHKNGVKNDNRVENLEWVTRQENVDHSMRTGLYRRVVGEENSCKLTEKQVLIIREFLKDKKYTQRKLAEMFKVNPSTIYWVYHRKSWTHI